MAKPTRILALLLGTILVMSNATAEARPVVIGYLATFKGFDAAVNQPNLDRYTHVNLAFANPDSGGRFMDGEALTCFPAGGGAMVSRAGLRDAVARLHAKGVKVSVSLGGGVIPACAGDWSGLLAPESRDALLANLLAFVDDVGLDGVDVDLEGGLLTKIADDRNYTPFVAALSTELKRRRKLLSCATGNHPGWMVPDESVRFFDYVNIMSYDLVGPSWGPGGGEHAPLSGSVRDIDLWRARGVPKKRLILGVPFYGYGFGTYQANWSYRDIEAQQGASARQADVVGDACAGCSYITFNSPETIRRKAALASAKAGGIMVWEISQDTPQGTLIEAVHDGLKHPER